MTKVIFKIVCFFELEFILSASKNIHDELCLFARHYYTTTNDFENVRERLLEKCKDEQLTLDVLAKVKAEIYAQKTKEGVTILLIGLVLILLGFVLTCFNYHSNRSVSFAMYGLTTIGISIVIWGLYKIMG
jgi:hypothetical protein